MNVLALDPTDADVLYMAGLGSPNSPSIGIERSLDGGQTWVLEGDTVDGLANIRALLVDPRNPQRLLAGTERDGALVSDDRGETWRALPGLEGLRISALLLDEGHLYAATSAGIWRMSLP